MAKFNKRLFGQEVSPEIIKEIRRLSFGGIEPDSDPTITQGSDLTQGVDVLAEVKPTFEKYLGDRTSFARMWCAVNIKEINKAGEVDDKTSKIRVFSVNENKR